MRAWGRIACSLGFLLAAASVGLGQAAESRIVWIKGKPAAEVRLDVAAPKDLKQVSVPVSLFDSEGRRIWGVNQKVALAAGKPAVVTVVFGKLGKPNTMHRAVVALRHEGLKLNYHEELYFTGPAQPVPWHSLRRLGEFPHATFRATVAVKGVKSDEPRRAQLSFTLRDGDENVVMDKIAKIALAAEGKRHPMNVTPPADAIGPFTLETKVESDALGWFFEASRRLARANALVPVTSFEVDDRTFSAMNEVTDVPPDQPRVVYDPKVRRSGRQALRVDYSLSKGVAVVHSSQVLPGLPTVARLWVKGNGSADLLYLTWHDHYELTRAHWLRFPNTSRHFVCTLNFEGWRSFRVPVLGAGLQKVSTHGSSKEIDAPIYLASLEIHPRRSGKDPQPTHRSVWFDDLAVETQARVSDRLSMELRADTADRRLHKDARVHVSIGNGHDANIEAGKLRVLVKDRAGQTIQQVNQNVDVPAGGFRTVEVPLGAAAAKSPDGPVDVDVWFTAPGVAGLRKSGRITLKSARGYALWWDFEQPQSYTSLAIPPRYGVPASSAAIGGQIVPGGAEGSAHALRVRVGPKQPNAVLLHPILPGMVDRIEVMVKATGKPVTLRPVLLDSGQTGYTNKNYNAFCLPQIKVDWQGWRRVELVAPPVPAHYDAKNRYFLNEPFYPLNLGFLASVEGETDTAEVLLDNIRVRTHLLPHEELHGQVLFPNDSHIHPPGAPLEVCLTNFAAADKKLTLGYRLVSFQGTTGSEGKITVTVPAGKKITRKVVPALAPGMYELTVTGLGAESVREIIQVLDARRHFGPRPLEFLRKMPAIRKTLDMTVERVYLDWDNTEGIPNLYHFHWFNVVAEAASADGAYTIAPVVGFAADWAGPHLQETIAQGHYGRYVTDRLQVPVRMVDWSRFVRTVAREFKGRFPRWIFWENPDLATSPQGIAPRRYPEVLSIFHKWVCLHDPKAKVVAGGFNMDKVLGYLESIKNPAELAFDEITVQMSLGGLSPEQADMEGLLDELNGILQTARTGKKVQLRETDWPIGKYVSPAQQAAYHARAMLILNSRGANPHQFRLVNSAQSFEGPGIFYHLSYGNSEGVQTLKPVYAPKPGYFALRYVRDFLAKWKFAQSVLINDFNRQANRAYLYVNPANQVAAAVWRTTDTPRRYATPAPWKAVKAADAFGFDVALDKPLRCAAVPTFLTFPPGYGIARVTRDLRTLQAADGKDPIVLALHVAEPASQRQAKYAATGEVKPRQHYGLIPGNGKLRETFLHGLKSEQFEFTLAKPGNVLLTRLWLLEGKGQKLTVQLNDAPPRPWDLSRSKLAPKDAGPRESTFVLTGCAAGRNVVKIAYATPGNCAAYRLEPLAGDRIDLCRWGLLHALQSTGQLQKFTSATGTPLAIGKRRYPNGFGTHAVSLIEVPLDGQFAAFEVTVGIDAVTDGRGTVVFEIHIDGVQKARTDVLNGFSKPVTLKVDGLAGAKRMVLLVRDGGDKTTDDLANWVNATLHVKK